MVYNNWVTYNPLQLYLFATCSCTPLSVFSLSLSVYIFKNSCLFNFTERTSRFLKKSYTNLIEQFLVRVRMYTIFGLNYLIYFESFFSFFLLETDPRPLYFKTFRLCYGDMWFAGGIYIGCWVIIPPSPLFNPFPVFIPARKFKKQGLIYLDFRSIFLKN